MKICKREGKHIQNSALTVCLRDGSYRLCKGRFCPFFKPTIAYKLFNWRFI